MTQRPEIFISATSADLRDIRAVIRDAVLDAGGHPVEQSHFSPAGSSVDDMLRDRIGISHAVVHIVGKCYGSENQTCQSALLNLGYAEGRRSYTQREFDVARELGKTVYVFICGDDFPYSDHEEESPQKKKMQAEHRRAILESTHLYEVVDGTRDLRDRILQLDEDVRLLGEDLRRVRSRFRKICAAVVVALCLLTVGLWILKQRLSKAEDSVVDIEAKFQDELAVYRESVRLLAERYNEIRDPEENLTDDQKLERALVSVAEQENVTVGELKARIDVFVTQIRARESTGAVEFYDLGLAAFAERKFADAAGYAKQAAASARTEREAAESEISAAEVRRDEAVKKERAAEALAGNAELAAANFDEAVGHYTTVVSLSDRDAEPEEWIKAKLDLADAIQQGGNYGSAVFTYRQVLAFTEQDEGADSPRVVWMLNTLGFYLKDAGEYEESEKVSRRALRGHERIWGADNERTLFPLNNLAILLSTRGKYDEAEPLMRRVLELRERIYGEDHPVTLVTVRGLAQLLSANGNPDESLELYQRNLVALEKKYGADSLIALSGATSLAGRLSETGNRDEAEKLYRRIIPQQERLLGQDHPNVLITVRGLGLLLKGKGDFDESEQILKRVYEARKRVLGEEHAKTYRSALDMASVLSLAGNWDEAEPYALEAYKGLKENFGIDHPYTMRAQKLLDKAGVPLPE